MGWLGEIAGLEAALKAATQKLQAMKQIASRHGVTHLGMPDFRDSTGRASAPGEPSTPVLHDIHPHEDVIQPQPGKGDVTNADR
jgi:hypothetical protein